MAITAFVPDTRIAFRTTAGPVRPEGLYVLEPITGGTRLRFALSCTPNGLAKLMTRMVAKAMQAEVSQLGKLKEVLER